MRNALISRTLPLARRGRWEFDRFFDDVFTEIDRVFRERKIEIAFPQHDLHIRSWVPAQPANAFSADGLTLEKKPADPGIEPETV
jgi:hypothetical protein